MNDNFSEQKDFLFSIKREINLLQQQVDYLIRNEQPLGLLDLDVMMNRIHTLYDMMCSVNLGEEPVTANEAKQSTEEELPVGVEEIKTLFGIQEETEEDEEEDVEEPQDQEEVVQEQEEENEDAYFIEEAGEDEPETKEDEPAQLEDVKVSETKSTDSEKEEDINDFSFILNFEPSEPDEEPQEEPQEEPKVEPKEEPVSVFTTGDEIEMTIPHLEDEPPVQKEEEIVYGPVVIGDMEDRDDNGFELEQPETLGDLYQQKQEATLGEKLQHGSVRDLQSAIGINDKFLFVNELFGGSMEKYNRSIENLNDLKTLNGALIYLNELRIELQWNSNNEAYKKLLELVHRKFEE